MRKIIEALLLVVLLSACSGGQITLPAGVVETAVASGAVETVVASGAVETAMAAMPTQTSVPLPTAASAVTEAPVSSTSPNGCPAETAELKLFTNAAEGYCFLYPASDRPVPPSMIFISISGNPDVGDATAQIKVEPAVGRTAAQVADAKIAEASAGSILARTDILMDGKPAVMLDAIIAQEPHRVIYIVGNDRLYTIYFQTWEPSAEWFSELEKLYGTATNSFHLFAPDACLMETAKLKLFTNAAEGYCFLYPAQDAPLPPNMVAINPNGASGGDFLPGDAVALVSMEAAGGRTAAQVADAKIAEAGADSGVTRSELLIDGKQAIVVDGLPAQDSERVVFIVGNDRLYTLHFQPWAPGAAWQAELELLYSTIITSFHLFTPAS